MSNRPQQPGSSCSVQVIAGTGCVGNCQIPMYTVFEYTVLEITQKIMTVLGTFSALFIVATYTVFR
jgi:hypothetical protein